MAILGAAITLFGVFELFALAWRRVTFSWRVPLYIFLVGLYACIVVCVPVEAVTAMIARALGNETAHTYTFDPFLEEIVKLLPVLYVAWRWRRTMSMCDWCVLGAASGAGYSLAESWLTLLQSHSASLVDVPTFFQSLLTWPPAFPDSDPTRLTLWDKTHIVAFSHMVSTALASLAVGAAWSTQWPHRKKVAVASAALAWIGIDHVLTNYTVTHMDTIFGHTIGPAVLPAPLAYLYALDWFGQALAYVLLAGLAAAIWRDGRLLLQTEAREPRLPDEPPNRSYLTELGGWLTALGHSRRTASLYRRFMRVRRQWSYGVAQDAPAADVAELRDLAEQLRMEYLRERDSARPETAGSPTRVREMIVRPFRNIDRGLREFARDRRGDGLVPAAYFLVWAAFFMVFVLGSFGVFFSSPVDATAALHNPFGSLVMYAAIGLSVRNLRRFYRSTPPATVEGEPLVMRNLWGLLAYGAVGTLGIATVVGLTHGVSDFLFHGGATANGFEHARGSDTADAPAGAAPAASGSDPGAVQSSPEPQPLAQPDDTPPDEDKGKVVTGKADGLGDDGAGAGGAAPKPSPNAPKGPTAPLGGSGQPASPAPGNDPLGGEPPFQGGPSTTKSPF